MPFDFAIFATTDNGSTGICDVRVNATGSASIWTCSGALPPQPAGPQQPRLWIPTTDATSVTVRVVKNGIETTNRAFPVSYTEIPGPNGPKCPPKVCRHAVINVEPE